MRRALLAIFVCACGSGGSGRAPDGGSGSADAGIDGAMPKPDPCIAAGTCPPGMWIDVTPSDMDPTILSPTANAYGPGSVVVDPARPSDLYIGGGGDGLWRSTDYGNTWTKIDATLPSVPHGNTIAVAGTTPATIWWGATGNTGSVYKSTDGGTTFTQLGLGGGLPSDLYSFAIDPADATHLISGLHEADGVYESTDGGASWHAVMGAGWPTGGISWFPFFVDTGDASTTRTNWFAIAQDGATPVMTSDGGKTWASPQGLDGLQHPHGNAQLYQAGADVFVAGLYGPGQGVYRSTDRGATWARVSADMPEAIVWGTPSNIYTMWSWACSDCNLGTGFAHAPAPGTDWTVDTTSVPSDLVIGAEQVAVTSDGNHQIFVGVMWAQGIWRYVEE